MIYMKRHHHAIGFIRHQISNSITKGSTSVIGILQTLILEELVLYMYAKALERYRLVHEISNEEIHDESKEETDETES